jgi:hypothetical protein
MRNTQRLWLLSSVQVKAMWTKVQLELETALATRFFPRLFYDKAYTEFLAEAGIRPAQNLDFSRLSAAQSGDLKNLAKLRMSLFIGDLQSRMAVEAASLKYVPLKNQTLYRAANSAAPGSPGGIWWFTEDIWNQCQREAGNSDSKRIHWLHQRLAVCYDWSKCDRIVKIDLFGASEIPAVQAIGLPKTRWDSPRMFGQPLPGITHKATMHGSLSGGLTQTILPFIPRLEIRSVLTFTSA